MLADMKRYIIFAPQKYGVVVQLVRMPACHAGGRGFESRPYRQDPGQMLGAFVFNRFACHGLSYLVAFSLRVGVFKVSRLL